MKLAWSYISGSWFFQRLTLSSLSSSALTWFSFSVGQESLHEVHMTNNMKRYRTQCVTDIWFIAENITRAKFSKEASNSFDFDNESTYWGKSSNARDVWYRSQIPTKETHLRLRVKEFLSDRNLWWNKLRDRDLWYLLVHKWTQLFEDRFGAVVEEFIGVCYVVNVNSYLRLYWWLGPPSERLSSRLENDLAVDYHIN